MRCSHVEEIKFAERAMIEQGKNLAWAGAPQGIAGVTFMMKFFDFCPWCGEEIVRINGPEQD